VSIEGEYRVYEGEGEYMGENIEGGYGNMVG